MSEVGNAVLSSIGVDTREKQQMHECSWCRHFGQASVISNHHRLFSVMRLLLGCDLMISRCISIGIITLCPVQDVFLRFSFFFTTSWPWRWHFWPTPSPLKREISRTPNAIILCPNECDNSELLTVAGSVWGLVLVFLSFSLGRRSLSRHHRFNCWTPHNLRRTDELISTRSSSPKVCFFFCPCLRFFLFFPSPFPLDHPLHHPFSPSSLLAFVISLCSLFFFKYPPHCPFITCANSHLIMSQLLIHPIPPSSSPPYPCYQEGYIPEEQLYYNKPSRRNAVSIRNCPAHHLHLHIWEMLSVFTLDHEDETFEPYHPMTRMRCVSCSE